MNCACLVNGEAGAKKEQHVPTVPLPTVERVRLRLPITQAAHFSRLQELLWGLVFNHVTSSCTTFRRTFQEGAREGERDRS